MKKIKQTDSIGYKGDVKIKTSDTRTGKTKTYKTHNAGQIGLFTFITQALQGTLNVDTRPAKINLYGVNGQTETTLLAYPVVYTTTPEITLNGSSSSNGTNEITYLFTVPGSTFIQSGGTINRIKLFNNLNDANTSVCAIIDLTNGINFTNTTNIIVEWKLKFVSE